MGEPRRDGEWLGINVSDLEALSAARHKAESASLKQLVFSPERVAMDRMAENDD